MMKQFAQRILLVAACTLLTVPIGAQQKKDAKAEDKKKPKAKPISVYLGKSDRSGGSITKPEFDKLMKQGVTSRDSAGKVFSVTGFVFNYAERNLYEDSVGNPIVVTDYLSEYCFGDTLTAFLGSNIPERSKVGDTVYIDEVMLKAPEGYAAHGKSMKFIITK